VTAEISKWQNGRTVAGHGNNFGDQRFCTLQLDEIARANPQADNVSLGLSDALDPSEQLRSTCSYETPEPRTGLGRVCH
jgi:hypothetical protein